MWGVAKGNVKAFHDTANAERAFAMVTDNFILVAFQGTVPSKLQTILADAGICLVAPKFAVPDPAIKVHCGFQDALNSLAGQITTFLQPFRAPAPAAPAKKLFITGHSLGGAMATLFAASEIAAGRAGDLSALYTFGSPRVGNKAFKDWFNAALHAPKCRFVNDEDIVTRVAPRELDYEHIDKVYFLDASGHLDLENVGWLRFLNTVVDAATDFKRAAQTSVHDHSMELYVKKIENLLGS
jgi:triacylglycerol lipase